MRYKDMVQTKINTSMNHVQLILRGLNNRKMTAPEAVEKLNEIMKQLEEADNLVEKETQGMN